jgi:hypothetical protein
MVVFSCLSGGRLSPYLGQATSSQGFLYEKIGDLTTTGPHRRFSASILGNSLCFDGFLNASASHFPERR